MPVKKEEEPKQEIAGAITFPSSSSTSSSGQEQGDVQNGAQDSAARPPRQPTNLQGLLRFAMEATKAEDGTSESHTLPMDEERKKFLEEALKSMTVDVMEILRKQIELLEKTPNLRRSEACEYVEALEVITDYVDNIDIANDFHKIGGFAIFEPCFNCENPSVVAAACNVLAELCQNNLYCQRVALNQSLMPVLIKILDNEENDEVNIKALYAVSCIIRENTEGFNQFNMYGGLTVLLKVLQKNVDKLRTKTTFLLAALCRSHTDLISRLVFLEYVPVLIELIKQERQPSHEHILSLLVLLVEESHTAQAECKKPEHNLKGALENHLKIIKNKDECMEEEQYCQRIITLIS